MNDYNKLINQIQAVRARNNKNWMALLRLAFAHAPEEAAVIMKKITNNDAKINTLSAQLGDYYKEDDNNGMS
jgi:hypothetical protein